MVQTTGNKDKFISVGKIRRSQAVTTFGPGAIIDQRDGSYMAAGIDSWPRINKEKEHDIYEPQLQAIFKVKSFRMPPVDTGQPEEFPVTRFPHWLICPGCHRLARFTNFLRLLKVSEKLECNNCRRKPYPARLVVACKKGHIEDFPWEWWVHRGEACDRPILRLNSSSKTASLAAIAVSCERCQRFHTLADAFTPQAIPFPCSGNRPWLNDKDPQPCDQSLRTLQRGASNLYYSSVASALSIPPWSDNLIIALQESPHWASLSVLDTEKAGSLIEIFGLPTSLGRSRDDIYKAIVMLKNKQENANDVLSEISPAELRNLEFKAIFEGTNDQTASRDFEVNEVEVPELYRSTIEGVRRLDRLREVRVLRGFTRIDPPPTGSFEASALAALTKEASPSWLPAIEVRGEGIFIHLNEVKIREWEQQPPVIERAAMIGKRYKELLDDSNSFFQPREISPRLLLTHTFAHLLIRQFSLVCGYSSSALRERIFVQEVSTDSDEGHAAFLLYTATADSEGSLGGLVRQCQPERLSALISGALEEARWCSSDPLCIESDGQGYQGLNLAACHACGLLPETCCEEFNRFLDRGMLTGTPEYPQTGFFSFVLENLNISVEEEELE